MFASGSGDDTINDFAVGSGSDDVLDLSSLSSMTNLAAVVSASTTSGGNTVIDLGGGDSVTLIGVDSSNFHNDDFDFS